MNTSTFFNVLLSIALVVLLVLFFFMRNPKKETKMPNNTIETPAAHSTSDALQPFAITKLMQDNPFEFFRGAGLVLAAGKEGDFNEMTIGWGGLGTLWSKPVVTVYVAPGRYTYKYMESSDYFTVMRFPKELEEIPNYMGSHSGRDADKAAALNLHTKFTQNGAPYFEEADLVIECRKIYSNQFNTEGFGDVPSRQYANFPAGIHYMYIGEVVSALRKTE